MSSRLRCQEVTKGIRLLLRHGCLLRYEEAGLLDGKLLLLLLHERLASEHLRERVGRLLLEVGIARTKGIGLVRYEIASWRLTYWSAG